MRRTRTLALVLALAGPLACSGSTIGPDGGGGRDGQGADQAGDAGGPGGGGGADGATDGSGDSGGEGGGACRTFPEGLALGVGRGVASGYTATLDNGTCDAAYLRHACCGPVTSWHLEEKQSGGTWKALPEVGPGCGCAGADAWRLDADAGKTATLALAPLNLGAVAGGVYRLVAVVAKTCDMGGACAGMASVTSGEFTFAP